MTSTAGDDSFDEGPALARTDAAMRFVVDIDGFEGPIDVLLALARDQKVDLARISIVQLADQYLAFVTAARSASLELAADYLVMAAWLAYLKSRLLLPSAEEDDEPSAEEMAAALAMQLRRLEAMQESGARLMARGTLGEDFFARGAPEALSPARRNVIEVSLFELLKAYGDFRRRSQARVLYIEPAELHTVERALSRFRRLLGASTDWESLWRFLPDDLGAGIVAKSAIAATFAAGLELVREGRLSLRQDAAFGPIYLRAAPAPAAPAAIVDGREPEGE